MENTENMGKITSLNEEYTRIKEKLEKTTQRYNEIAKKIEEHNNTLVVLHGFKKNPELITRVGSNLSPDQIDSEINSEEGKIASLQQVLTQWQVQISDAKKNIDYRVGELVRENPEVADAIKAETVKKYKGKTIEKQEEVRKLSDKQKKIKAIKDAVKENPALREFLRPILEKQSEINSLETQLKGITVEDQKSGIKTYTDDTEAKKLGAQIKQAKEANMKNKHEFIQSIGIEGLQIEDIDELISGEIVKDEKGNVIVDKTIEKKEESIERQLDENNKDISHYLSELKKRGEISPAQEPKNGEPGQRDLPAAPTKEKWYKKLARKISNFLHRNNEETGEHGDAEQEDENVEQQDDNMRSQQEEASKEFLDRIRNLGIIKEVVDREGKPFERTNAQPQQDNSKQDHGGPEL